MRGIRGASRDVLFGDKLFFLFRRGLQYLGNFVNLSRMVLDLFRICLSAISKMSILFNESLTV